MYILGFLKQGAEFVNLIELRGLLLSHRISYATLLSLIVHNSI